MRLKTLVFLVLTLVAVSSCNKKSKPEKQKDYTFTYNVRIANKITEPTIISGYHGHVKKYEGNFQPAQDPETGKSVTQQPEIVRNEILIYNASHKSKIDSAAYQRDGVTFYNLKKLKKQNVTPKYIVRPNKSGFYQIDLGTGEFLALIRIKKNRGYYNSGVRTLSATTGSLKELEMRIDYNASF